MKTNRLIVIVVLLFGTGCAVTVRDGSGTTPTPSIVTQTLPPSATLAPTYTSPPPPPTPTPAPVEGTASTQVNVRAQPSTTGEVLGIVAANAKVQIIGRDPGGNWWQILYPASLEGKGWVTAQYVTTTGKPEVPVVGGTGTSQQSNGNVAIIQQQLNIRSGPGTGFNSIGTLNPQDVVTLTGKDAGGAWLQIEFAAGPDGRGWINAAFVQAIGAENLPIITEAGLVAGTGTPTGIPPTPTATFIPAPTDGDSAQSPAVNVALSASGTRSFQYSGDVSAPEGDGEDWIAFSADGGTVYLALKCAGNASLQANVLENGVLLSLELPCGGGLRLAAQAGSVYQVRFRANPSLGGVQYTRYTIRIGMSP